MTDFYAYLNSKRKPLRFKTKSKKFLSLLLEFNLRALTARHFFTNYRQPDSEYTHRFKWNKIAEESSCPSLYMITTY